MPGPRVWTLDKSRIDSGRSDASLSGSMFLDDLLTLLSLPRIMRGTTFLHMVACTGLRTCASHKCDMARNLEIKTGGWESWDNGILSGS